MPRGRKQPAKPRDLSLSARDRIGRDQRIRDQIDRMGEERAEMVARGRYDEAQAHDRRRSELAKKLARPQALTLDQQARVSVTRRYAFDLAKARRRGKTRDLLAHLARFVDELTPELLQAADVYRMARGVDKGWPGCSLSFIVSEAVNDGGRPVIDASRITDRSGPVAKVGQAASDVVHEDGAVDRVVRRKPRPTFKPKSRNKVVRRAGDGGMVAMIERRQVEQAEAARILSEFDEAVIGEGYDLAVIRAAESVVLHDVSLTAAAKSISGAGAVVRRQIISAIITGLSAVANSLRLSFGRSLD